MSSYVKGDTVKVTATFAVDGGATDPTAATIRVKAPGGTVTVYDESDMTHVGAGVWQAVVVLDQNGTWYVRAEGTGAAAGVEETAIVVSKSKVV